MRKALRSYQRKYLQEILKPDSSGAAGLLNQAIAGGVSAGSIYCDILGAAQAEVGRMRHAGQIGAAQEHLATSITDEQCVRLREKFPVARRLDRRVLVSTFPGEQHTIGAKIVSHLFSLDGWQVDFMPRGLALEELINFVKTRDTDILALSLSLATDLKDALSFLQKIRLACPELPILVGGTLVQEFKGAFELNGVEVCDEPAMESVRRAARLVGFAQPRASLEQILSGMGSRIRALRKCKKMNQLDLGQLSGLDRAYISSIEQGKKNITIGSAYRIACALGVSIDEIISGKQELIDVSAS